MKKNADLDSVLDKGIINLCIHSTLAIEHSACPLLGDKRGNDINDIEHKRMSQASVPRLAHINAMYIIGQRALRSTTMQSR